MKEPKENSSSFIRRKSDRPLVDEFKLNTIEKLIIGILGTMALISVVVFSIWWVRTMLESIFG